MTVSKFKCPPVPEFSRWGIPQEARFKSRKPNSRAHVSTTILHILFLLFLKNFFYMIYNISIQSINNVLIVSGGQQRDSAIHTHVSVLPQNPLPSRLPQLFLNRLWSHLLWRQVTKNYLCKPLFSSETHLCRHTVIRLQACNILSPSPLPEVQSPGTKHLLSHLF